MRYKKLTESEYVLTMKENHFIDLLFQWMWKIIQPLAILLVWTAWFCILMIFLTGFTGNSVFIEAITYIWSFMLLIFVLIIIIVFSIIVFSTYIIRSLIEASEIFQKSKVIIEPIAIIMKNSQYIYMLISRLYRMNKFISFFWDIKAISKIDTYLEKYINDLVNFLLNLRSDLATHLTEQRSILESAKTEVEQNITGTPELLAVSEAQKLRLDRQIEQFEELQRVLVRV